MSDWTPAFPGQRPPFQPGNSTSVTHGATSPARVAELAAELEAEARGSASWPAHLHSPVWAAAVRDYFRARAVSELLWRWLADQDDVMAMLAETGREESEETSGKGRSKRVTASKRVGAVLSHYNMMQGRVMTLSRRLGLDPQSHVAIAAAMASTAYMLASGAQHPLDAAVDRQLAEDQRRRELDAGGP